MNVAGLIARRLEELGKSRAQLRGELVRAGIPITRQAIHGWFTGRACPSPANVVALWDVLLVPLEERPAWMEALARGASPLAEPGRAA